MWQVAGKKMKSRFLLGTAQYPSLSILLQAIASAKAEIVTVSLKRQGFHQPDHSHFWQSIKNLGCHLLPNTAGCHLADEAITVSQMARELFETNWIKLEVIGDDYSLQPDPFELVKAASVLVRDGFHVFPYCTDDLILCQRLMDSGCEILMPWGAPIGSGQGLIHMKALLTLRERLPSATLIIDAGIGKPSHAMQAMELGFDGVLLNTAVALAKDPVNMALAFREAISAGRLAFQSGLMLEREVARASTSLIDTPFWVQEKR